MSRHSHRTRGFTLMELLMALALFTIAAVSLAEALNLIGLTVAETIDESEVRESLRAVMVETARDPALRAETRETNPDERGLFFEIAVERLELQSEEGANLTNLFEVVVTAKRSVRGGRVETLDSASTYANPNLL